MAENEPAFTIGIEEEYLLVDTTSRDLCVDPPEELLTSCQEILGGAVAPEFLRCQIEVGTPVCKSLADARRELARLRSTIAEEAGKHGLAPIAASTHPFAQWSEQRSTDKPRYREIAESLQVVGRRLVICGMHVHVGVEDPELRIDLHNQLAYFLPHLLCLSTSSPFWQGRKAGLKSFRLTVFDALPRSGPPERFSSFGEFERFVSVLTGAGVIEDATKIWWDLRPSVRFPTLEMRVTDVCTRVEDALAIAATFRCLARMLWRLRRDNQRWRHYPMALIAENRWIAQRHGAAGRLIDFGRGELVPFSDLAGEIIDLVAEDADHFGCASEVERIRGIASGGTSADKQLAVYEDAIEAGASEPEALREVVDHLIAETLAGCKGPAPYTSVTPQPSPI
ncbi:carboxylate-amine ligase [Afifella sp. IM 167]|uniref:carboxylate-amine ligase n=1 Tax=Afifella sp. IM 167 TaxID=2033586 RepID=UPI001CCC879E|nr:carboxylate-amine ligase [Afifella sp. IM 167]MBZ8134187.1 carboxylate-amine ligase [Afifella sp. IM 167]